MHRSSRVRAKRLREARDSDNGETCFVVMPFGDSFDRYYQNIFVPAIEAVGLSAVRGDSLFRSSDILGDIWSMIRTAKVLLADLSGRNPNVFYELGLAHALGKPVVLVSDQVEDVPFDLRGFRVSGYDKNHERWGTVLRQDIRQALKETLDDLNSAVPPTFFEATKAASRPQEDALTGELREIRAELRALRSSPNASQSHDELHAVEKKLSNLELFIKNRGDKYPLW